MSAHLHANDRAFAPAGAPAARKPGGLVGAIGRFIEKRRIAGNLERLSDRRLADIGLGRNRIREAVHLNFHRL